MPLFKGSVPRRDTSLGVHVRGLYEALSALINDIPDVPSERRVRLRTVQAALIRAYPSDLLVNDVALAQQLEEEDGIPIEDAP